MCETVIGKEVENIEQSQNVKSAVCNKTFKQKQESCKYGFQGKNSVNHGQGACKSKDHKAARVTLARVYNSSTMAKSAIQKTLNICEINGQMNEHNDMNAMICT